MAQITVGVPTYNRPALLEGRIRNILDQSFGDIEVIVSDNSSSEERVEQIGRSFVAADSRVKFFRQPANIGSWGNFTFVLEQATTEFFIWAADDDQWDRDFLRVCMSEIGPSHLYMPSMVAAYTDRSESVPLPDLGPSNSIYENARRFISNMQPNILYGLHRRRSLVSVFEAEVYDHSDVVLVYRAILAGGVVTGGPSTYYAGMNGTSYTPKPFGRPGSATRFSYRRFVRSMLAATWEAEGLTTEEKVKTTVHLFSVLSDLIDHLAGVYPAVARPHHVAYHRGRNAWRSVKSYAKAAIGRQ